MIILWSKYTFFEHFDLYYYYKEWNKCTCMCVCTHTHILSFSKDLPLAEKPRNLLKVLHHDGSRWVASNLASVWCLKMIQKWYWRICPSPRCWRTTAVYSLFYLLPIKYGALNFTGDWLLLTGLYCLADLEGNLKVNEQFNSPEDIFILWRILVV